MNVQNVRNTALIGGSLAILAGAMLVARSMPRTRRYRVYFTPVRDAGPENMANPPAEWDAVDECIDASFPASDPPCYSRSTAR